jgi:two-component system, OmpR family, alkaline phosphatase synthesis response regulator PhoP
MSAPHPRPLILVADNETDIIALVRFRLEREGYEVISALDGAEALRLALERRPDAALLDVRMPALDGYEVVRKIRQEEAVAKMPVIMLSASIKADDVDRSYEAGADHHLGKPFSPDALAQCVRSHLDRTTKQDAE